MHASKIILAVFIAYCVLFLPHASFGQTETLDILQYTPPQGWTKTAKEGAVVFSDINQTTKAFCMLTIYPTISSGSRPQQDFVNAWNSLVVKPFKAPANPKIDTQTDPDGWQGTVGAAEIDIEGVHSYAILSVFTTTCRCPISGSTRTDLQSGGVHVALRLRGRVSSSPW